MAENEHDLTSPGEPNQADVPVPQFRDPAAQSLADALRVSFRLLRILMIAVVVLFMATGIKTVEEQEMGILKVFGRTVGTVKAGAVFNWPFPIGEIEIVDVRQRSLEINDFWMHVAPADKYKDIGELPVPREGLIPGLDGALFTGDRNLIHVRLACSYAVRNPEAYARTITDLDNTVRSVVCTAAIEQAGRRTAKSILQTAPARFADDVQMSAQDLLDKITGQELAIQLNSIVMDSRTWPLRALPAYEKAQRASQDRQKIINDAIGEAGQELNEAAGGSYVALVGRPWGERAKDDEQYDLIGQYEKARGAGEIDEAERLAASIDERLTSSVTGGEASKIMAEATSYKTTTIEQVKARAERFSQLLPEFEKDAQFMMDRLWAATRDKILGAPTNEKFYVTLGDQKFVWRIARDPGVAKQIREAMLKAEQED